VTQAQAKADWFLAELRRHQSMGDWPAAEAVARRWTKEQPRSVDAWQMLGSVQHTRMDYSNARKSIQRAIRLKPDAPLLHFNLAMIYRREGRYAEAYRALAKAKALRPGFPVFAGLEADMLCGEGRYREAYEAIAPLLGPATPPLAPALAAARALSNLDRRSEAIELLERAMTDLEREDPETVRGGFALLANLLDAEGDADAAFAVATRANGMQQVRLDEEGFLAGVERLVRAWSPEAIGALPVSRERSELPVYIVGMPRSGTSLIEQILASHPHVYGAGELPDIHNAALELGSVPCGGPRLVTDLDRFTPNAVNRLGRDVIRSLRRSDASAARVTDKMPGNHAHLGVIGQLCPGARVIHCLRDPMDTCLSCYLWQFGGQVSYANDLRNLGVYYRAYRRIMDHWWDVLRIPIMDVRYEALIEDQERVSRELIDFVGLEWDDACLRFHKTERVTQTASADQVRRPVYRSSVGKHERYATHLEPLREALGPVAD